MFCVHLSQLQYFRRSGVCTVPVYYSKFNRQMKKLILEHFIMFGRDLGWSHIWWDGHQKVSTFTRDTASFAERRIPIGEWVWLSGVFHCGQGNCHLTNLHNNNQRYYIYQLHDYSNYITWYLLYTWNANLSDMHTELFTINKYNAIQLYKSWGIHVNYCRTNNLKL